MFQTENGFHTDIDSDKAKIDINDCNFCHVLHRLILSGMREGTFHPLSFLDQILSVKFLSKISKLFGDEN